LNHKKKVILSMPEPERWTFMSYESPTGLDVIQDKWDVGETDVAELAFEAMVKNASKIADYRQWPCWRHPMTGKAGKAGVVELEFSVPGTRYRVLAMFNGKKCIVLLCICYHKQSVWTPASAVETATKRANEVTAGKVKCNVIEVEQSI
jgi:phage-related protein